MNHKLCFGVDLGGTSIKIGLFDDKGVLSDKWQIPTNKEEDGKYILNDIKDYIDNIIYENEIDRNNIIGIGLGIPGPVRDDGVVLECVNLGWGIFNVAEKLSDLTGLKVKVNNDANVAALGEQWQGGGQGYKSTVFITLGTGVGGGIIIDDKIISGSNGAAGEIGHISVEFSDGLRCNCGKDGCLEQYASATGIVNLAKKYLKNDNTSSLMKVEKLSAKNIFDCAKDGDEISLEVVKKACEYLGKALTHIAAVVDPEAFVIGGGVSYAGQILIDHTKEVYESHVMKALKGKEFKLATLGNDAGMYGAAKMMLSI